MHAGVAGGGSDPIRPSHRALSTSWSRHTFHLRLSHHTKITILIGTRELWNRYPVLENRGPVPIVNSSPTDNSEHPGERTVFADVSERIDVVMHAILGLFVF
jgi:hypothetical protein